MKEDLSAEIHDLTRKQLYQSSWNLAGTLKHKVSFFLFQNIMLFNVGMVFHSFIFTECEQIGDEKYQIS